MTTGHAWTRSKTGSDTLNTLNIDETKKNPNRKTKIPHEILISTRKKFAANFPKIDDLDQKGPFSHRFHRFRRYHRRSTGKTQVPQATHR